jgi:hypothetical protein
MRAVFVDADEALAAVTEKLRSPGDPSLSIHRDIKVKSAQAARCVWSAPRILYQLRS